MFQHFSQIGYFSPLTWISSFIFSSGVVFWQEKNGLLQWVCVWVAIRLMFLDCLLFVLEVDLNCLWKVDIDILRLCLLRERKGGLIRLVQRVLLGLR